MKKRILIVGLLTMISQFACAKDSAQPNMCNSSMVNIKANSALPELHKIKEVTFETTYSCNGDYETSALFLSDYAKRWNSPDLLINGACGSRVYIHTVTAGNDYGLVSDLGPVSLYEATAQKAFNWRRVVGHDNVYKEDMPIEQGHVYSVLVAKSDIRAQFFVEVVSMKDRKVTLRYAVKNYELLEQVTESPGFSWDQKNLEDIDLGNDVLIPQQQSGPQ